jgi:hypothetical protein
MKSMREWEELILNAKVTWQIFQEDCRAGSRGGGILCKSSHEDDSLSKSVRMDLPDTPGLFTFTEQMVFGKVKFKAEEDREEGGEESKELDVGEDLQEIRAAIWEMDTKMHHVVKGLHVDQVGMRDHLWKSIKLLGCAIDQGDAQMHDLDLDVSDVLDVLKEHNIVDLSEGASRALGELDTTKIAGLPLKTLGLHVDGLLELINAVDEDHQKAGKFLLGKLKSMPMSSQQAAQGVIAPQGNLVMSMMILDDSGAQAGTLGQLLWTMLVLQDNNTRLWVELVAFLSNITAQGGVVLDGLGFTTEAQVRATVLLECPLGNAFKVFLGVVLLFCCNPMYAPIAGWEKTTCSMDEDYSAMACKVVSSYHQTHCAWYMEGKIVMPGKVLGG